MDIQALVAATIDTTVPEPFGAYLFFDQDPGAEIARSVERSVLLEAFGNTPEQLSCEYGRYESTSMFFCVIDHRRKVPAGAMRLVVPTSGGQGLKSLDDLEPIWGESPEALLGRQGIAVGAGSMWDIATLVVAPEYRTAAATGLVSLGLYQSVVRTARQAGIDWLVAILDRVVYRMTKIKFGEPFFALAEGRPYLGSKASLPVYCQLSDWHERLAQRDPAIFDVIYEGIGIEAALRPLDLRIASSMAAIPLHMERPISQRRGVLPRGGFSRAAG